MNKILFLLNKIIFDKISRNNNEKYRNFSNIRFLDNEFNKPAFN